MCPSSVDVKDESRADSVTGCLAVGCQMFGARIKAPGKVFWEPLHGPKLGCRSCHMWVVHYSSTILGCPAAWLMLRTRTRVAWLTVLENTLGWRVLSASEALDLRLGRRGR